jgi:hypothetical protein
MRTMMIIALCAAGCLGDAGAPTRSDAGYVLGPNQDLSTCQSNNDGILQRSELPLVLGVTATYLQNPDNSTVTVDTAGQQSPDGPAWDLTSTAGVSVSLPILSLQGLWFENDFPGATYVTYTDTATKLYGVFKLTDDALQILGYASEAPNQTLIVYDAPVDSIRFPLAVGASWQQSVTATNGLFDGLPYGESDKYTISVEEEGVVELPFLSATKTLRIHVDLVATAPSAAQVHTIQYLFFHECVGELGRMVSVNNETNPAFTTASIFRRLAL